MKKTFKMSRTPNWPLPSKGMEVWKCKVKILHNILGLSRRQTKSETNSKNMNNFKEWINEKGSQLIWISIREESTSKAIILKPYQKI